MCHKFFNWLLMLFMAEAAKDPMVSNSHIILQRGYFSRYE